MCNAQGIRQRPLELTIFFVFKVEDAHFAAIQSPGTLATLYLCPWRLVLTLILVESCPQIFFRPASLPSLLLEDVVLSRSLMLS